MDLTGVTVHFVVEEVHPDSLYGYNIWAGEHLNFVSTTNPNVQAGDTVTVKVTSIETFMSDDTWIIHYKLIDKVSSEPEPTQTETEAIKEYKDAASFEADLNAGKDLTGVTVHFVAEEVHPDSALGYNIWAGEHLNFVSSTDPGVSPGESLTVRITSVERTLGSWILRYQRV